MYRGYMVLKLKVVSHPPFCNLADFLVPVPVFDLAGFLFCPVR